MAAPTRRPATVEELRALAHPMRQRILRLCRRRELTTTELAERLRASRSNISHHVRALTGTGFLLPLDQGERPKQLAGRRYTSTRKSWYLDIAGTPDDEMRLNLAIVDAFRAEFEEGGPEGARALTRLALTLNEESFVELRGRLESTIAEFAARSPDHNGEAYGLLLAIHRLEPRVHEPA
jgi:DNA-binding transcriptional ArsR family regulator